MTESTPIHLSAGSLLLDADLAMPRPARGLVVFAHGSGSSRHSPRNRLVATALNDAGFATLLLDLLTPTEDHSAANRFNLDLLSQRLAAAVDWAGREARLRALPIGLFGASTGAAAAILVAADRNGRIAALVSRGGRPDLAGRQALAQLQAPTLLIVGGDDEEVLALNEGARAAMRRPAVLAVVPGATHLFAEPGTLERVAELASDWFTKWLVASR